MFSFFRKKENSYISLTTDLHSHLIPGIDDGAKDMQESLMLLKGLADLGYKKVITTPHIMSDGYKNTRSNIMQGLTLLRIRAKQAGIDIAIDAGAEYYLDDGFYTHLDSEDVLTVGDNYLLFETSYIAKPLHFKEMIFAISSAGYKPLFAHPERYRYIKDVEKEYVQMKEMGIFFQINSNSFGGHYGKDARQKALYLSKKGMIDFLGSDVHHIKHIQTLKDVHQLEDYQAVFKKNKILNGTL